jgi:hypothetical protein
VKTEGRVFALTGPQMLELAAVCEYAAGQDPRERPSQVLAEIARCWAAYLRREHVLHFGESEAAGE